MNMKPVSVVFRKGSVEVRLIPYFPPGTEPKLYTVLNKFNVSMGMDWSHSRWFPVVRQARRIWAGRTYREWCEQPPIVDLPDVPQPTTGGRPKGVK